VSTVCFCWGVGAGSARRNGDGSRCRVGLLLGHRGQRGLGVVDGSDGGHAWAVWLCLGSDHPEGSVQAKVSDQDWVDLAGDVAFQAADDFAFGEAFAGSAGDVVAGAVVVGHACEHDAP